jgi:hypothetical protein
MWWCPTGGTVWELLGNAEDSNLTLEGYSGLELTNSTNVKISRWFGGLASDSGTTPTPPVQPVPGTTAPFVTGTLAVGQTLTANPGAWTPTPGSYRYRWRRSADSIGTGEADITGATGSTYTLVSNDQAKYIRVAVLGLP